MVLRGRLTKCNDIVGIGNTKEKLSKDSKNILNTEFLG